MASSSAAQSTAVKVDLVVGSWLAGETDQAVQESPLKSPFGVDFDPAGNMFIVELEGGRVHRLDARGQLQQISGDGSKTYRGDGGPAGAATFNGMHNVAVVPSGDVYIADSWNHCIRKIDAKTNLVSTIAGTGTAGFGGDGGPATKAQFDFVMCITLNADNDKLYVADLRNRRIRVVDLTSNTVETVAGNGERGVPNDGAQAKTSPLVDPRAVCVDSQERVYILERGGHALRVVENGTIKTVAGSGQKGYRDGKAIDAQFGSPKHVCVDQDDNVYIADDQNRAIRKYDPDTKLVSTVLGRGLGQPAVQLSRPHGVCVEGEWLLVVDTGNDRILRIRH